MDDFTVNVKQIGNYPAATSTDGVNDLLLLQSGGLGGPYQSIAPSVLVGGALAQGGVVSLGVGTTFNWAGGSLSITSGGASFGGTINGAFTGSMDGNVSINGSPAATMAYVDSQIAGVASMPVVSSFNGRTGDVQLETPDIMRAGALPQMNPVMGGMVIAPTVWDPTTQNDQVATTAFVHEAMCWLTQSAAVVSSINGRRGDVILNTDDITTALSAPGAYALGNTPPTGDASKKLATTMFVDNAVVDMQQQIENDFQNIANQLDQQYAPIHSPQFTGVPTAPTPPLGDSTGNIATTAFVHAAVVASTTGVASFNTRTGAVVLTTADVTGAGGAPLNAPSFTGLPLAPTATPGTNNTQIATTAFVNAAIAALNVGVASFNTRTGAVVLTTADVTAVGAALLASPAFSGTPTAPTAAPNTNDTQLATTAYVDHAVSVLPAPVTSFNSRTGAVVFQANDISAAGGALLAGPQFTGVPTAPTATPGNSTTQLATTAFVQAALSGVVSGVSSFNTRTGAVSLLAGDLTAVGGALLAGPVFTGVPAAPTAVPGTNTTQLATTAFVQSALAAAPGGVSSFNTRTGAITLQAADVSGVGGALLASPNFSGVPTAPTAAAATNTNQLATTAFVQSAITAAGGVSSFNGRAGAVTLNAADILGATGATLTIGATAPASPQQGMLWWDSGITGNLYLYYNDGSSSQWVAANTPPSQQQVPPRSYLAGLTMSVTGATTFTVAPGVATDNGNTTLMTLAGSVNKTTAAWSAGSGGGALETGSFVANQWYHVFLIMNPTSGAVDVVMSATTTPALGPAVPPSGFSLYRRIGSMVSNASTQLYGFLQYGDTFLWLTPPGSVNGINIPNSPTVQAVATPPGIVTIAILSLASSNASGNGMLYVWPVGANTGLGQVYSATVNGLSSCEVQVLTNTSSQVNMQTNTATGNTVWVYTKGWIDRRGRDT